MLRFRHAKSTFVTCAVAVTVSGCVQSPLAENAGMSTRPDNAVNENQHGMVCCSAITPEPNRIKTSTLPVTRSQETASGAEKVFDRHGIAGGGEQVSSPESVVFRQHGIASWYGKEFNGHRTSSGERFDMNAMTAAHRTLPLGSYARVTLDRTGKSVIVRINDRGPVNRHRIIDLSYAAASALGIRSTGTGRVEITRARFKAHDNSDVSNGDS